MMKVKSILLDIMIKDSFVCQLKYSGHGYPELIDGDIIEVYKPEDLRAFVEEQKPSLKDKDYHIEFSTQRVLKK